MKKLLALTLSFLMVLTCTPVDGLASAASAQLNKQFGDFFSGNLTAEERALVWANRDLEDEDGANANSQAKQFDQQDKRKKPEPQEDLETYFLDNELLSSFGDTDAFDKRQDELAFYILNSDWRTYKGLSQGDKAVILGLVKLAQAFLGWMNLGVLDNIEASIMDKTNNQGGLSGESLSAAANIFESAGHETHDIDELYIKIQNNAFHVVLLNRVDFEKMVKKYPEVAFLFEDLYTFFRWRYEMRSRDEKYRLNENNIYHVMNSATRINSFLGWWELANVAKWFMANTITENKPEEGLYPFTMKTYEEEKNNLKVDYRPSARDARYFGRVWNCMQRYAAINRHMEKLDDAQGANNGLGTVLSPKRGFKLSVKRAVYKSLAPLSDQEVYDSLKNVRYQYVAMRARSEVIWRKFMTTQVDPLITGSTPAWKEKLTDPTPFINDEDIKTMKDVLSLFGVPVPPSANFEGQPTPEENYDEPEQVADDNDPVEVEGAGEGEGESEGENQQEVADQVTQSLKQKFGK